MDGTGALRAFIGSFTSSGGRGVVQADVEPGTGALTAVGTIATVPDPSYLAVGHRDTGPVLYRVSETARGAVAAYDVSGPAPRPLDEPVPVHGAEPTHLTVCRDHLGTADFGSGSVTVLPLAADGAHPRAPSSVLRHEGSGPHRAARLRIRPTPSGPAGLRVRCGRREAGGRAQWRRTAHPRAVVPPPSSRGGTMADQREETGRIVVGVDGSDSSKQALRWAVRQAELTHGLLEAVTAWDFPQFHGALGWLPPSSGDEGALEGRARQELAEAVEETVGSRPPVEVRTEVRYGTPASVLLNAAHGASLLVVGSRGLGGFAGLLLGSVAQHCIQHADCPVVVFRDVAAARTAPGAA